MKAHIKTQRICVKRLTGIVWMLAITVIMFCAIGFKGMAQTCESPLDLGTQWQFGVCYDAPISASPEWTASCPSWYTGQGYWFRFEVTQEEPVNFQVTSTVDYIFDTGEPTPWFYILITDECGGETIYTNSSCDPFSSWSNTSFPGEGYPERSYYLDILLEPGEYFLHCGSIGVVPDQMEGCFSIAYFQPGFLSLGVTGILDFKREIVRTHEGVFIRQGDKLFDLSGRLFFDGETR